MNENISKPDWEDFTLDNQTESKKKDENMSVKGQSQQKEKQQNNKESISVEEMNNSSPSEADESTVADPAEVVEEAEEKEDVEAQDIDLVDAAMVDQLTQERDEYLNHLRRLQAEFDNYRKRMQKERLEMKEYLLEDVVTKLLDVVEGMERALHLDYQTTDVESYRTGVEMVYNKLMTTLGEYGLKRVETTGQPFDPRFHEAVMRLETNEHEPGTIINEFSPGYCLKDRVLKAPKVQVAAKPSVPDEEEKENTNSENE